jgi:poly(A) polymerase
MSIGDNIDDWQRQILQQVAQYFEGQGQETYLVGGSVRNLLWGEPCLDWDIATTGDAPKLARKLANKLNGYYAYMNARASRVTLKQAGEELQLDIAPCNGDSIEEDLRLRDFTINAIAVPLSRVVQHLNSGTDLAWIDPLNGRADIQAQCLRAVDDGIFQRDPLRMLRAVRFMMLYGLSLDKQMERMLTRDAGLLLKAAPERIHDELYAILRPGGATEQLRLLDKYGLFTTLMPEFIPTRGMPQPSLHHWDVLQHSLEAVAALERLTHELQQEPEQVRHSVLDIRGDGDVLELRTLLYEAEQQGIFQFARLTTSAMKLAALLHDVGKSVTYVNEGNGNIHFYHHPQAGVPLAQQIMQRLSASTQDKRLVQQVVANHMRPGQLSGDKVTPRAIRRYFTELGPTGIYVALISLSDHLAMRGPEPLTEHWARHLATVRLLCNSYIRERDSIIPPRLLQGEELIRHLHLEPGPIVGQLLEQIAEAQAEGKVHSKAEALWFAEEVLTRQV